MHLLFSYEIGIYKLIYTFNLTLITFIGKLTAFLPLTWALREAGKDSGIGGIRLMVAFPFFPAICIVVYAQVL